MNSNELAQLYLKTLVSIEEEGQFVPVARVKGLRDVIVHVLTAWNPGDERPTQHENASANQRLRQALIERGLEPRRAVGADPDSDHVEESWAIIGLNDNDARAIGASFGQIAIFRIAEGCQTVLACEDNWSFSRPL